MIKITPSLLLRFPQSDKKIPPANFPIPAGGNSSTPYYSLENPGE